MRNEHQYLQLIINKLYGNFFKGAEAKPAYFTYIDSSTCNLKAPVYGRGSSIHLQ